MCLWCARMQEVELLETTRDLEGPAEPDSNFESPRAFSELASERDESGVSKF
jgi:hypothetical protein